MFNYLKVPTEIWQLITAVGSGIHGMVILKTSGDAGEKAMCAMGVAGFARCHTNELKVLVRPIATLQGAAHLAFIGLIS